jgi:hypothetical protein
MNILKINKTLKKYFKNLYVKFRDFYNYRTKKIVLLEKEKQIIQNKKYIYMIQTLSFLNLNFVINYLGYNYIYSIDNIFFYKHSKLLNNNLCLSTINKCIINLSDNISIDFTENIIKYNLNVPFYLIINNENFDKIISIKLDKITFDFEISEIFKTNYIKYKYDEIKYKSIYEILKL